MIDSKETYFLRLKYDNLCLEHIMEACSYIHWDEVDDKQNGYGSILDYADKHYPNTGDRNLCWTGLASYGMYYKDRYPRTKPIVRQECVWEIPDGTW